MDELTMELPELKQWDNVRRICERFADIADDEKQRGLNEMNMLAPLDVLAAMLISLAAFLQSAPHKPPPAFEKLRVSAMAVLVEIAAVKNSPLTTESIIDKVKEELGLK